MAAKKSAKTVKKEKSINKGIPTGVKIISVLYYIGAAFLFLIGLLIFFLRDFVIKVIETVVVLPATIISLIHSALLGAAIFLIILGIAYFFLARGLWKLKNWARIIAIVIAAFGVVSSLFAFPAGIIHLIINGIILWYLGFNEEAKKSFS